MASSVHLIEIPHEYEIPVHSNSAYEIRNAPNDNAMRLYDDDKVGAHTCTSCMYSAWLINSSMFTNIPGFQSYVLILNVCTQTWNVSQSMFG